MVETNIRGKRNPYPKKIPFDDVKELNECCNCEGCLCEDLCKEYEDEYLGKGGDMNERTNRE